MCYYYNKPDCCIYHTVLQRASEKNIGNTFDLESTYTSLQQEEDNSRYVVPPEQAKTHCL